MLRITSVSPGAVDYLLRGSDCAQHEHAGQVAGNGSGQGADGVGYLLAGAEREPAGVWFGSGLPMVGVEPGSLASEEQVRAVFGRLEHPTRVDREGEPVPLGSRPGSRLSWDQRVAQRLAAEPDATEERRAEITAEVSVGRSKAVAYYDLTFSPVKSVSLDWAALLSLGRLAEAANVVAAHRAGVAAAMAFVEREAAQVRSGYHGKDASGQSVGRYEAAAGLVWIRWDHSTSRAQEPQMHSHVSVLNRAVTVSDGVIRALDGRAFRPIKQGADAIYRRTYEQELTASNGVVFATRPDGRAREILGFPEELLRAASTRNTEVAARRDVLVEQFEQAHGRAPSPSERRGLDRAAWRETRQAKDQAVSGGQQVANWVQRRRRELGDAVAMREALSQRVAAMGHPDHESYAGRSRGQVLRAAVAAVQGQYATWDFGNLVDAVEQEQHRTPSVTEDPVELAAEVLAHADRYGVVNLARRDIGTVPAQLRGPTGRSVFRPRHDGRFATTGQLRTETAIVARARTVGAAALTGAVLDRAEVDLARSGLSDQQREGVLQIVGSGRRGDVLIGPAGAGKSRTVGALARVWETHIGGRVWGVATSTNAANVLADDGLTAMNSTRFRMLFAPDGSGQARQRLGARDLVVVDEAGMSNTAELDEISALLWSAGAKLLYTGDHKQLSAVGAGGMLELLERDAGAVTLTEIHRFTSRWEAAASTGLRDGRPEVLGYYQRHGRIRGGTIEEMAESAVHGYLADALDGRQVLLVVRDNATAAALSRRIRDELVSVGRVGTERLAVAGDGNPISVGDLVQARRNDHTIPVDGPGAVTNREVFEVLGRNPLTGALTVRRDDGARVYLPDVYVGEHTTLAYAVTTYAAQGVTVDVSHALIDPGTDRAGLYVPGSRGRNGNFFYVVCQRDADLHEAEPVDRTAVAVLRDILTRTGDIDAGAEVVRRIEEEAGRSLAWVGTQWDLVTAELAATHAAVTLGRLLGPDVARQMSEEPGWGRLVSAVRSMDLAGHDPAAVLAEAVARGSLHDATSVSDVLRYRVRLLDDSGRRPERVVRDGDWTTFTTPIGGPLGGYVQVLAEAATARQIELGERAAADPPAWALTAATLGPPLADALQQVEWVRRAGIVATYRDLHAIPDTQESIGAAPSREREFHHALWRQASTALGHPADVLDYATATDGELREMRDAWHRAQTWAPAYVADHLHQARVDAEDFRRDYLIWRAEARLHATGDPKRDLAERDIAGAEKLRALTEARAELLEQIQVVRDDWSERTRELQQRAAFAGDELERRGLDRDTVAPVGEQQELFTMSDAGTDAAEGTASLEESGNGHVMSAAAYSYAALLADAERAMEQERHQPGLFDVQATPGDVAAAQPLSTDTGPSVHEIAAPPRDASDSTDESAAESEVTVGQAAREAEVVAALRARFDARAAATARQLRAHSTGVDEDDDTDYDVAYTSLYDQDESRSEQTDQGSGLSL